MVQKYVVQPILEHPIVAGYIRDIPKLESCVQILRNKARNGLIDRGLPEHDVKTLWEHEEDQHRIIMLFPAEKYGLSRDRMVASNFEHDTMPETLERDHTPQDKISAEEKFALELRSCNKLMRYLGFGAIVPARIVELKEGWLSYHYGLTPEDRIVKQIDKIIAYKEAMEEKSKGRLEHIDDFYSSAKSKVSDEFLCWVLDGLRSVENACDNPHEEMETLVSSYDLFQRERDFLRRERHLRQRDERQKIDAIYPDIFGPNKGLVHPAYA